MAFLNENFQNTRTSAFADTVENRPAIHFYKTTDEVAVVAASGYFNELYDADLAGWETQPIIAGDEVHVVASDGVVHLVFDVVAATMTTDYVRNWSVWTVAEANTVADAGGENTYNVAGVLGTDKVIINFRVNGGTPVSVESAATGAGTVTVTYSADPGTSREVDIIVLRRPRLPA